MVDLVDGQTGFVGVQDRLLRQDLPQALLEGLQGLVLFLACRLQGAFTDGVANRTSFASARLPSRLGTSFWEMTQVNTLARRSRMRWK